MKNTYEIIAFFNEEIYNLCTQDISLEDCLNYKPLKNKPTYYIFKYSNKERVTSDYKWDFNKNKWIEDNSLEKINSYQYIETSKKNYINDLTRMRIMRANMDPIKYCNIRRCGKTYLDCHDICNIIENKNIKSIFWVFGSMANANASLIALENVCKERNIDIEKITRSSLHGKNWFIEAITDEPAVLIGLNSSLKIYDDSWIYHKFLKYQKEKKYFEKIQWEFEENKNKILKQYKASLSKEYKYYLNSPF